MDKWMLQICLNIGFLVALVGIAFLIKTQDKLNGVQRDINKIVIQFLKTLKDKKLKRLK